MVSVQHADLYLRVGAGLDYWCDQLLAAAGNRHLNVIDCSRGIVLLHNSEEENHGHGEHEAGNPHYWLGPSNLPMIAQNIAHGMEQADAAHTGAYAQGLTRFLAQFETHFAEWKSALSHCGGARIVTFHRSWDYLARDFGMQIVGTVEPHPGAEPSPESLALLEEAIHDRGATLLLLEPYESARLAQLMARDTGITVVTVPSSAGSMAQTQDIFSFFDFVTHEIGTRGANAHP